MFAFYVCTQKNDIESKQCAQTQIHKAHKRARFTFAKYQKSKSNLFDGLCALCVRVFFFFISLNSFRFDVSFSFARVFLSIILTLFHTLRLSLFFHRKKSSFAYVFVCALAIEHTKQVFILASSWLRLCYVQFIHVLGTFFEV